MNQNISSPRPSLVVFSFRRYDYDFRRYLVEAATNSGALSLHVQWAQEIVLTLADGSVVDRLPISSPIKLIVQKIKTIVGDEGGIFLNSLGCQCPQDMPALRVAFNRWLVIFDVFDELSYDAHGLGFARFKIKEAMHRWHSDLTLTLSPDLLRIYPDAIQIDNASHVRPKPNAIQENKSICIIASIDPRVDVSLIERCAKALRDYRILIYGRIHHNDPEIGSQMGKLIQNNTNVSFEGSYKSSQLEDILSRYRIGLVPYYPDHPLTAYINPDKYYHYLRAGMEVLTPPLPQARRLGAWLHEIGPATDIRATVERALAAPKNPGNLTADFSWDARWAALCNMTAEAANRRKLRSSGSPYLLEVAAVMRKQIFRALSRPSDDRKNE